MIADNTKTWFGHPRGLAYLFFTEMWERFSYYGMRALLILYMTKYLLLEADRASGVWGFDTLRTILEGAFGEMSTQAISSQIYGLYTGLVYFTPLFGGLLADQVLGKRKAIYIGGILMMIGHFLMAYEQAFLLALLFLIAGNGLFKPNISAQIGDLYVGDEERQDHAFMIFYMGINLGALLSPLVCGTLGQKVGWHYGFAAAGVGMLVGLFVFWMGRNYLPKNEVRRMDTSQRGEPLTSDEWKKVGALVLLCTVNILFWAVYEQQGNSLQIWADQNANWNFLGFEVPSSWFQSFNPLIILAFTPVIVRYWTWQSSRKKEPNTVNKMAIGCFYAGLAYIFMLGLVYMMGEGNDAVKLSFLWLFGATFLFTVGELYISPIGLSLVVKLSPVKIVSMMMGVWFLSSFFGGYAAGAIGGYYEKMGQNNFFVFIATLGFIAGVIFLVSSRFLRKYVESAVK